MPIMERIVIGDIIEISTAKGLAYAQYTHKHPEFGFLMRCVEGIWQARPQNFTEVVKKPNRFVFFFPLHSVIKQGLLKKVGNEKVPEEFQTFPLFRTGMVMPNRKVASWRLWDGSNSWIVGKLTEEQKRLPIRGVWNLEYLVENIESEWRPEYDVTN